MTNNFGLIHKRQVIGLRAIVLVMSACILTVRFANAQMETKDLVSGVIQALDRKDPRHLSRLSSELSNSTCQGKVEMSSSWQSRNVLFLGVHAEGHDNLCVPVKRRRAMLASNPIKE